MRQLTGQLPGAEFPHTELDQTTQRLRGFLYQAIGQLASRAPQPFHDEPEIAARLISALSAEPAGVRAALQEAVATLASAYKGCPGGPCCMWGLCAAAGRLSWLCGPAIWHASAWLGCPGMPAAPVSSDGQLGLLIAQPWLQSWCPSERGRICGILSFPTFVLCPCLCWPQELSYEGKL